jgi:hypothetical protein
MAQEAGLGGSLPIAIQLKEISLNPLVVVSTEEE